MENTEGRPPVNQEKPIPRRTFLKGAVVGALGLLGIQKAAEQAAKINPQEISNTVLTGVEEKFKADDMRGKLMPDKQPSQKEKDASVEKFKNPPPTLERPKKQY